MGIRCSSCGLNLLTRGNHLPPTSVSLLRRLSLLPHHHFEHSVARACTATISNRTPRACCRTPLLHSVFALRRPWAVGLACGVPCGRLTLASLHLHAPNLSDTRPRPPPCAPPARDTPPFCPRCSLPPPSLRSSTTCSSHPLARAQSFDFTQRINQPLH